MPRFVVTIQESRTYEVPVEAISSHEARAAAFRLWREVPSIGEFEIDDPDTVITDVSPDPF